MGKSKGKAILGIIGFAFGAGWLGGGVRFGLSSTQWLLAGLYGASLGTSLWSMTHKQNYGDSSATYNFDQIMNQIDSNSRIPIIYGTRKWGGQQTYHKTASDKQSLSKDIVWCEGEIESISDVRADDLLMEQTTVFSVQNTKYQDAYIELSGHSALWKLTLFANGTAVSTVNPFGGHNTVQYLVDSINGHASDGWVASTTIGSEKVSSSIGNISKCNCYDSPYTISRYPLEGCTYRFSNGASSQPAPDNYSTVGGYKNVAWSRFNLTVSEKLTGGNPTVTAIIKGMKVRDTRINAKIYSSNPAMCVRDYLLSKRYGAGHFITADMLDEDSFREVADYNDQLVTTRVPTTLATADAVYNKITELQQYLSLHSSKLSTEEQEKINNEIASLEQSLIDIQSNPVEYTLEVTPRHSLNIIIAETKSHIEILQDMFAVFGGFLVFTPDKISLRCEKETPVSYAFTDDTIIQDTLDHTQYPIDQSPNRYSVKFYDPDNQWTGVKVIVEDAVDQKERGKIINKDVDLTGCTSQSQALRLARLYRDKMKLCSIVVQFQTATMAMHLEPGDVITVSKKIFPNGVEQWLFQDMPFRILEISEQKGIYSIKAEQYNASIYNDSLGAQIQPKNYVQVPNPISDEVPIVTNLSTLELFRESGNGQVINEVKLMWSTVYQFYDYAEVYMLSDNPSVDEISESIEELDGTIDSFESSAWTYIGKAQEYLCVSNLIKGITYKFKFVTVNTLNRKSNFNASPVVEFYCQGKTLTPGTPTGLTLSFTDMCSAAWNMAEADVAFWELRMDTNTGTEEGLLARTTANKATPTLPSRKGTVFLFAHNTAGFYSNPCILTYNKTAPAAPTNVTATDIFQGFIVTCDALPAYCSGISVHINNGTGDIAYFSPNSSYTFKASSGIFDIQVAYVDLFGEGALSSTIEKTVKPTVDPDLIAEESLSLAKMDATIKDAVAKAQDAVSGTVFNDTINQLTVTDGTLANQITQTASQTTIIVTELNKPIDQSSYTSIVQALTAINLRVTSTTFNSAMQPNQLITQINLANGTITLDGKLVHITGDTLFDANVIVNAMIAANAITADKIAAGAITTAKLAAGAITADKIAAGAITADKISAKLGEISGKLTANQIDAGVISADKITSGVLSADIVYSAGYQVKVVTMVKGSIANGATIPLPAGFTHEQCTFGVQLPTAADYMSFAYVDYNTRTISVGYDRTYVKQFSLVSANTDSFFDNHSHNVNVNVSGSTGSSNGDGYHSHSFSGSVSGGTSSSGSSHRHEVIVFLDPPVLDIKRTYGGSCYYWIIGVK
ncbi:phage tail protein [Sporomusa aerivorans]|uniref:phage tail protein n=1 Tax=Sporomusa aerivorans TaxID=204936 RepID=UPI00352B0419